MKKIIVEKPGKIIKNKKELEKNLGVKLSITGKEVSINGTPEEEYYAEKMVDALSLGFPIELVLLIKEEDYAFEILNIKDFTKRKDFERIRGRIIGTNGKALKVLNELTKCNFVVQNNQVGIIGDSEYIKNGEDAVISIIRGARHANVYGYLEKHHVEPIVDLGLKEKKTKS